MEAAPPRPILSSRPRWFVSHVRVLTLAVLNLALLATVVVVWADQLELATRNPSLVTALETAATLVAVFAGILVWGRFRRTRDRRDLALVTALIVLGSSNLAFRTVPAVVAFGNDDFRLWASVIGQLLSALAFLVSAYLSPSRLRHWRRAALAASATAAALLAMTAASAVALGPPLPAEPAASPRTPSDGFELIGDPLFILLQLAGTLVMGFAAWQFARRSAATGDELIGWFAIGTALSAVSRFNGVAFPSLALEYVYLGDLIRIAFYLVLLVGAAREIGSYQRSMTRIASLEERRRVARELHDGVAQELAFIVAQTTSIARQRPDDRRASLVAASAERALDESRAAISALSGQLDVPLDEALERAARDVASRAGANVSAQLATGIYVDAETRHALARIVREAVANAVRHGRATNIELDLSASPLRLSICDDGAGFDQGDNHHGGFGLTSMRERAQSLGADFAIESSPGSGTRVRVQMPA